MNRSAKIARLADLLRSASRVFAITGAGMSADSGLPTYRGVGGLYNDTHTDDGIPIERALSGAMLHRKPDVTWRYIRQIEEATRGARFNRGHEVLAALESRARVTILTQNVDGLHQAAGSSDVIDIHGDIHALICTHCDWEEHVTHYRSLEPLPRCPHCSEVIRPDVVLFGEMLPVDKLERLRHAMAQGFDLVLSIGTTSVFPYIAAPVVTARRQGIPTVEVNPGKSEVSDIVDIRLQGRAAIVLDDVWNALQDDA